jgi:hypothetical protein
VNYDCVLTNSFSRTSCRVIEWLKNDNIKPVRINDYVEEFNKVDFHVDLQFKTKREPFYWINKA